MSIKKKMKQAVAEAKTTPVNDGPVERVDESENTTVVTETVSAPSNEVKELPTKVKELNKYKEFDPKKHTNYPEVMHEGSVILPVGIVKFAGTLDYFIELAKLKNPKKYVNILRNIVYTMFGHDGATISPELDEKFRNKTYYHFIIKDNNHLFLTEGSVVKVGWLLSEEPTILVADELKTEDVVLMGVNFILSSLLLTHSYLSIKNSALLSGYTHIKTRHDGKLVSLGKKIDYLTNAQFASSVILRNSVYIGRFAGSRIIDLMGSLVITRNNYGGGLVARNSLLTNVGLTSRSNYVTNSKIIGGNITAGRIRITDSCLGHQNINAAEKCVDIRHPIAVAPLSHPLLPEFQCVTLSERKFMVNVTNFHVEPVIFNFTDDAWGIRQVLTDWKDQYGVLQLTQQEAVELSGIIESRLKVLRVLQNIESDKVTQAKDRFADLYLSTSDDEDVDIGWF